MRDSLPRKRTYKYLNINDIKVHKDYFYFFTNKNTNVGV